MRRVALLLFLALASAGCERGFPTTGSEATIPQDQFVDAMVELRIATIRQEAGVLPVSERDEILRRRGLEPEDLLRFAEVHGADVPFMLEIWSRVDSAAVIAPEPLTEEMDPGSPVPGEGIER